MGQEAACTLRIGKRIFEGKAYLETDHILFRGGERVRIPLRELTSVRAAGGVLTLAYSGGPAALELGDQAEKWERKILHPPSLLDKLGVKPGVAVALAGEFEPEFVRQLGPLAELAAADIVLLAAPDRRAMARVDALRRAMRSEAALWVVYPKGVDAIRQDDVFAACRGAGLKDVKVASFSATHTALKFVGPRPSRATSARA